MRAVIRRNMNDMVVVLLAAAKDQTIEPLLGWRYLELRSGHGCRLTPQLSGGALPLEARRMCTMQ